MKLPIYNVKAEMVGERELNPRVFDVAVNESLVHQAVVAQQANERQVLAHTKDRAAVRGGGKKPWRQKGTGRARAGSSRSPLWRGGGVTFGPTKDRNFSKKINLKMKRQAICMVLSDKVRHNEFLILDDVDFSDGKTKSAAAALKILLKNLAPAETKVARSIAVVADGKNETARRALRNLVALRFIPLQNISVVDLLAHRSVIMTQVVIDKIEKTYALARA